MYIIVLREIVLVRTVFSKFRITSFAGWLDVRFSFRQEIVLSSQTADLVSSTCVHFSHKINCLLETFFLFSLSTMMDAAASRFFALTAIFWLIATAEGFSPSRIQIASKTSRSRPFSVELLFAEEDNMNDGVVELGDDDTAEEEKQVVAPFLSQGEIADDVLSPDLSDPKQTRVIIYIILSLVPVLFLVPLMLGSRDFLPADFPPAQM